MASKQNLVEKSFLSQNTIGYFIQKSHDFQVLPYCFAVSKMAKATNHANVEFSHFEMPVDNCH